MRTSLTFIIALMIILSNLSSSSLAAQTPSILDYNSPKQAIDIKTPSTSAEKRIIILDLVIAISSIPGKNCDCPIDGQFYSKNDVDENFEDFIAANEKFKLVVFTPVYGEYTSENTEYELLFELNENGNEPVLSYNPKCHKNIGPTQNNTIGNNIIFDINSSIQLNESGNMELDLFPSYDYGYVACESIPGMNLIAANTSNNTVINAYPNPTKNTIHIPVTGQSKVSIFNQTGQQFTSQDIILEEGQIGTAIIDVTSLSPGIYFININTGKKTRSQKFIKL